jgi:acetyltransferase-like isoleucine patch superfamily enzyme
VVALSRLVARREFGERGARRERRAWQRIRTAAWTPPPPSAFGRFGESFIVPPARVELPECIFIGDGVLVHEEVWFSVVRPSPDVTPRLAIGDRTRIGRFCQFSCVGCIDIGVDVLIGDQVQIGDTSHGYEDVALPSTAQPMTPPRTVRIGDGAFIGTGAIVLPGVTIGDGAYVSEASVVGHDVVANTVVVGNPARPVASPQR